MTIREARFIASQTTYTKCPEPVFPEYAFIGRSNVGKSSLINMLTGKRISKDFRNTRQDSADQSFHDQRSLVPGWFARLWIRKGRQNGKGNLG